jgi:hypothetical protein
MTRTATITSWSISRPENTQHPGYFDVLDAKIPRKETCLINGLEPIEKEETHSSSKEMSKIIVEINSDFL